MNDLDDQLSEPEAKRRMDDALRRALSTRPQPHKSSGKSKTSPKPKARKSARKRPRS